VRAIAASTPPLAVPSSLVITRPVSCQRVVEGLHLRQRVLAGVAVDDQQHFVRRAVHALADHALDLLQLFHQVQLGRQAAGGIDHDHVHAARLARLHRVEGDRGRVARFLRNHGDVVALAPDHQLLARGGAEGVAGGQQHRLPCAACAWPACRWWWSCRRR
jgi:hypothetical protein